MLPQRLENAMNQALLQQGGEKVTAQRQLGARILIVDDQSVNLVLLTKLLGRAGYSNLKTLDDPRSALNEIASFEPDAILLDVQMPHISGLEVLEMLRAQGDPDDYIPVIMLSANPSPTFRERALEGGATDFLPRPFDNSELKLKLRNALHIRTLHQQLRVQNTTLAAQVEARTKRLKEREAEAVLHAQRIQKLADLSAQLEVLSEPHAVARMGLQAFLSLWKFDLGVLYRPEDGYLTPMLTVGKAPPQAAYVLEKIDIGDTGELHRRAVRQTEPVFITDYSTWEHATPRLSATSLRTVIALTLRVNGAIYAVMYIGKFGEVADVDENAHAVLQAIQRRIERALERTKLLENLRNTREDALRVVGLTLEYRDYETKGHTDRVTQFAQRLGDAVNLDATQREHLLWGSYLHDTGKIAIPDQILLKPGKLTDEEFDFIKTHVTMGADMLSNLDFLPREVLEIVEYHHERWDGRGYPDGLAGEEIPLLARIFSVADVYDALTSERPYKKAWTHEDAVAELIKQRGTQFDPALVDAFVARFELERR